MDYDKAAIEKQNGWPRSALVTENAGLIGRAGVQNLIKAGAWRGGLDRGSGGTGHRECGYKLTRRLRHQAGVVGIAQLFAPFSRSRAKLYEVVSPQATTSTSKPPGCRMSSGNK